MTYINKKIVKNGWQNVDHLCEAIRAASMKKISFLEISEEEYLVQLEVMAPKYDCVLDL